MQNLKNFIVGFLISFIGSIPLGYLNVVGFNIYKQSGLTSTLNYLLGIVCIEFIVIYLTLIFANELTKNEKLNKFINIFSVIFLFILAVVFYFGANNADKNTQEFSAINVNYFIVGLLLNSLNFVQIPFWTGWNLYLINNIYIDIFSFKKYFYIIGTTIGTFSGMLALILTINYFVKHFTTINPNIISKIIAIILFGLGLFQLLKLCFKKKF